MRAIAKLFLNSLYGKQMQKPILSSSKICDTLDQFLDFGIEFDLNGYTVIDSNRIVCTGLYKDKDSRITKPSQNGSFILAYSRKIMNFFCEAVDKSLESSIFTYTDTDSLHLKASSYKKLVELGYIVTKDKAELGKLCSDIDNEGIIYRESNLAPKCYVYEYINNQNRIKNKDLGTMKLKGIPKKDMSTGQALLKYDDYVNEQAREVKFLTLTKKALKLNSTDKAKQIENFNIVSEFKTRTLLKTKWVKMDLIDNKFYPKNYDHSDTAISMDDFDIDVEQYNKNNNGLTYSQFEENIDYKYSNSAYEDLKFYKYELECEQDEPTFDKNEDEISYNYEKSINI
jgi:hypothetical protein